MSALSGVSGMALNWWRLELFWRRPGVASYDKAVLLLEVVMIRYLILLLLLTAGPVTAGDYFRCNGPDGVVMSDIPCSNRVEKRELPEPHSPENNGYHRHRSAGSLRTTSITRPSPVSTLAMMPGSGSGVTGPRSRLLLKAASSGSSNPGLCQ